VKYLNKVRWSAVIASILGVMSLTQMWIGDPMKAVPTALTGVIMAILSLKE
jgi:hypothetical protein